MQNFDEMAEKYLGAVEKQKRVTNPGWDGETFTRGDMETCYVTGAQETEVLQPGEEGTFGQAVECLKRGFKVARKGWNGKGMYLWLKPACVIKKEWCRDPRLIECIDLNGGEEILALGTICMYTHDSTGRKAVLTGWLASQSDMLCEDWYIVGEEVSA